MSLKTLDGRVTRARAIFNYAAKNGFLQFNLAKLWGTEFDKPEKTVLDKEVSEVERLFTPDEIRSVLALANPR